MNLLIDWFYSLRFKWYVFDYHQQCCFYSLQSQCRGIPLQSCAGQESKPGVPGLAGTPQLLQRGSGQGGTAGGPAGHTRGAAWAARGRRGPRKGEEGSPTAWCTAQISSAALELLLPAWLILCCFVLACRWAPHHSAHSTRTARFHRGIYRHLQVREGKSCFCC